MNCKDCIHYEICSDFKRNICKKCNDRHNEYVIKDNGICDRFQSKDLFIELPCKVGKKIYVKCRNTYINTGKFRISDYERFRKTVFLTKEEAEKALDERNEEDECKDIL